MKWFKSRNGKKYDAFTLNTVGIDLVQKAMDSTKADLIEWINIYVPIRTGLLRRDLIKWINTNWINTPNYQAITLGISNPEIDYWKNIINPKHTDTWFEHSGQEAKAFYGGYNGKVLLNDPQAVTDWYIVIGNFIKDKFYNYLRAYKDAQMGG